MAQIQYKKRIADQMLQERLQETGAVLIQGPKWCGKTTTALQQAGSSVMLANPQTLATTAQLAHTDMSYLLSGETPRLFDEWQSIPELWDSIRYEVDMRALPGQFILTGSAVPLDSDKIRHSGAGRYSWVRMRPMSLWESEESTGDVSLKALFDGQTAIRGRNKWQLTDIAYLLCRGGWPDSLTKSRRAALETSHSYVQAIIESDVSRVDNTLRNPQRILLLMRSLARLQGTQTSVRVLRDDMLANDEGSLSENTVNSYLNALRKIFVIEDLPAWSVHLRSKTAIRTSDTRYFIDPSIATASLNIYPEHLMSDLNTFGLLFETMCMRDLRVYADSMRAQVYHYRDKDGLECDAVFELRDGVYGLIEIKLGGLPAIAAAQQSLNKLATKIDTEHSGKPAFRMVLTAVGEYAVRLDDGTIVVPIGCLKP